MSATGKVGCDAGGRGDDTAGKVGCDSSERGSCAIPQSKIRFVKMHGLGNDYVYVDAAAEDLVNWGSGELAFLARRLSNRNFGVGSDGLILVCPPSDNSRADVRMRMFNADGSESEMCGNGVRCVCKFAVDRGLSASNPLRVETGRGVLSITWHRGCGGIVEQATVDMGEPQLTIGEIPAIVPSRGAADSSIALPFPLDLLSGGNWIDSSGAEARVTLVGMGNPHAVIFCTAASAVPLGRVGPLLEHHCYFPNRVNVHFAQVESRESIVMRTWERGAGVTLACGTGAAAVCVAGAATGRTDRKVRVRLPGGSLGVEWCSSTNHVIQTGPATEVYSGIVDTSTMVDPPCRGYPSEASFQEVKH